MSAEKITETVYRCKCELKDCPGKGKPWTSDNDKIPRQCRWCFRRTWNGIDLRPRRVLTVKGKTKTVAEWARESGISKQTIKARIDKFGWSAAEAVSVPANGERKK